MAKKSANRREKSSSDADSIVEVDSSSCEESSDNESSFSSSSSASLKRHYNYKEIKKEVYLWVDSELKNTFTIDNKLTWAEQKEEIVTKLLPPLYKLVNKKYDVTNNDLLNMLYGRWRSRHRAKNIESQGENQVKYNKRRVAKNTRTQNKKKRRAHAVKHLMEGNNKYIKRYPEKDLVHILKNSGYHSSEWEETDPEEDWPVLQPEIVEDESTIVEAIKKKTTSLYIYEKWWRSSALKHLLHHRVDPMVQLLRKKESIFKQKRVNRNKTDSVPPIGTPNWCLNIEALEKFGRPTDNIPKYDPEDENEGEDIEDLEDEISDHQNDESNNNSSRKKKEKKQQKRRKEKEKQKRKEKRTKTRK